MKARTDCTACRKRIYKEAETAYLKQEYKFFEDAAYSMAYLITAAALSVFHRRGLSKAYIRSFYDELLWILKTPSVFGKEITMTDTMKMLTREYGIDFERIELNLESEREFISGTKKALKEKK